MKIEEVRTTAPSWELSKRISGRDSGQIQVQQSPAPTAKGDNRKSEEVSQNEQVKLAVEALNKAFESFKPTQLRFKTFEETDQIQVQVVDQESGKVVKEIPPQEIIEALARFREFVGWFLDERA